MDIFPIDDLEYRRQYLQDNPAAQENPGLRLFLDSARPDDWKRFLPLGVFFGVTTNPLLLERSGQDCTLANLEKLTRLAADYGVSEIHLQTWGKTPQEMVQNGSQLALFTGLGIDVAVKVPATEAGYQVANRLGESGCTITLTGVYNPGQVLLAAGFGAAYAAPYLGRINDQGRDGRQAILAMRKILDSTRSETRLLVASLRTAAEVVELAQQGCDTLTFGAPLAADLIKENLTDAAAEDFERAAQAMNPNRRAT